MKRALIIFTLLILAGTSFAWAEDDVVMKAMRDELARSMSQLRLEKLDKPYFIAYRVDESAVTTVSATLGELTGSNSYRTRYLSIQMRVGDYKLDNTNFFSPAAFGRSGGANLALDDDYGQIRRDIWLATDAQYKDANSALSAKRAVLQRRQGETELPDFNKGNPFTLIQKRVVLNTDVPMLEKLARDLSAAFKGSPDIVSSGVNISVNNAYLRFVNSEGTVFTRSDPVIIVTVGAQTQTAEGTPLEDSFQVYSGNADVLNADALLKRTRDFVERMKGLRTAATIERYNGPVLFQGEAAGEAFAQVFAPAVVAGRFPVTEDGQMERQMQQVLDQLGASLADRIGSRVLPESFDITDNPKINNLNGAPLLDAQDVDDEGTPTVVTKIVEGGTLQALLSTRTPTPQTSATTGSAGTGGATPTNLIVSCKNGKPDEELRAQLLKIAKQRGYDYGIVVRHVGSTGLSGITRMAAGMMSPNSSNQSFAVYKVFADGHEELVRADIATINLATFKDILAAGDKPSIYNGAFIQLIGSMIGGGRGGVSIVSYAVPSLLFEQIILKKPSGISPRPPIVASPLLRSGPNAVAK